jgi:hypothetical protein
MTLGPQTWPTPPSAIRSETRHLETLIAPQEDRASRPDYMAGAVKTMDGIMETALPRNGQDGLRLIIVESPENEARVKE